MAIPTYLAESILLKQDQVNEGGPLLPEDQKRKLHNHPDQH